MSIEYIIEGSRFSISYKELQDKHDELCALGDAEFMDRLPEAMHFACVVAWFKELPTSQVLADMGIVHELAHLIHLGTDGSCLPIRELRERFRTQLTLS